jgi:hypothetical protein
MSILDGADVLADYFVPSYTAGEAISAGDAVALDLSDNKIYKASASAWSYRINLIGFAIAGGSSGASIPVNDTPIVAEKTGLTPGSMYYLSNTQGAVATSAGTIERRIGRATSSTRIKRPKNGAPVSGLISRALSSATAYAPVSAYISGIGQTSPAFQVILNGTTLKSTTSGNPINDTFLILEPNDVITMDASGAGTGTSQTTPLLRILDR